MRFASAVLSAVSGGSAGVATASAATAAANGLSMCRLLGGKGSVASVKYDHYARYKPSPVTISHFLEAGRNASCEQSFSFLRKEIPVRLAHIMKELELLPEELQRQGPCVMIQNYYAQSFQEVLRFENAPNDIGAHGEFTEALKNIRSRHANTVQMMAEAVMQMKEQLGDNADADTAAQYFLDRLYMSRISIHMLINQHAIVFGDEVPHPSHVGCIDPVCDVERIVRDAYGSAAFLCDQNYMMSPNLNVSMKNACDDGIDRVTFAYVPSHLYHILFELFKNALRATVETHEDSSEGLPDVNVQVVKSACDVSIRISDQGGGIPHNLMDHLFLYMYTTAPKPSMSGGSSAPMAGLGYGLPLSRLYARYFHGDISLSSMDGYGTDAYVYLRALAKEAAELLPVYNKMAKSLYLKPRVFYYDWTDPTATLGQQIRNSHHHHLQHQQSNHNKSVSDPEDFQKSVF